MKGKSKRKINFYSLACPLWRGTVLLGARNEVFCKRCVCQIVVNLEQGSREMLVIVLLILLLFSSPGELIYHFII